MNTKVLCVFSMVIAIGCGSSADSNISNIRSSSAKSISITSNSFTDPHSRFSINLPSKVKLVDTKSPSNDLEMLTWDSHYESYDYIINAIYAPPAFLDDFRALDKLENVDNNPVWRTTTTKAIIIDGQNGKQVQCISRDGIRASISIFTRYKGTVVSLSIQGPPGLNNDDSTVKSYFESFRFVK